MSVQAEHELDTDAIQQEAHWLWLRKNRFGTKLVGCSDTAEE